MASGKQVEIVAVVSSDSGLGLGSRELMTSNIARSVQLYRTGSELLDVIGLDPRFRGAVVVVDSKVDDIAPFNLVDALRTSGLGIDVVVALANDNADLVSRAMLAGARAAVRRECSDIDLELAIERVVAARPDLATHAAGTTSASAARGLVVAFVGARGGAGRSTLASLLASLAARGGIDTGLLDLDLQFGDLSLLFGSSSDASLYELTDCADDISIPEGFGRTVLENLTLYTPTPAPEAVELLAGRVGSAVAALAGRHKLLVVSTGAFWTLLHAELLESSDQVVCVLDHTVPGVRATAVLSQRLERLGVPRTRLLYVVNKVRSVGVNPKEVARALDVERVWTIPDGGPDVSLALDAGGVDLVADMKTPVTPAVSAVLDEVAMRESLPMRSVQTVRQHMGHRWGKRKPTCRR